MRIEASNVAFCEDEGKRYAGNREKERETRLPAND